VYVVQLLPLVGVRDDVGALSFVPIQSQAYVFQMRLDKYERHPDVEQPSVVCPQVLDYGIESAGNKFSSGLFDSAART